MTVGEEDSREGLAVDVDGSENGSAYTALLRCFIDWGLRGVRLVVPDDHESRKVAPSAESSARRLSPLYFGSKTARSSSGVSKVSSRPSSFPSRVTAGGSTWVRARASTRPKTVLGSSSSSTCP